LLSPLLSFSSPSLHLLFTFSSPPLHLLFTSSSPPLHLLFTSSSPPLHLLFTFSSTPSPLHLLLTLFSSPFSLPSSLSPLLPLSLPRTRSPRQTRRACPRAPRSSGRSGATGAGRGGSPPLPHPLSLSPWKNGGACTSSPSYFGLFFENPMELGRLRAKKVIPVKIVFLVP